MYEPQYIFTKVRLEKIGNKYVVTISFEDSDLIIVAEFNTEKAARERMKETIDYYEWFNANELKKSQTLA